MKQKTTLEEDNIVTNFINQYSREINIVLNICRLILNKNKNIDTFLTQFTSIENKIVLRVYIIGRNHKSNLIISDKTEILEIIKTLKDAGLIIETDKFINTLESNIIITLCTDKLKKNKQNINDIETYLKLRDLYIDIPFHSIIYITNKCS